MFHSLFLRKGKKIGMFYVSLFILNESSCCTPASVSRLTGRTGCPTIELRPC